MEHEMKTRKGKGFLELLCTCGISAPLPADAEQWADAIARAHQRFPGAPFDLRPMQAVATWQTSRELRDMKILLAVLTGAAVTALVLGLLALSSISTLGP